MAGTPLLSVIVPVYNSSEFISQCLDSLIAQTLTDIEVICIDDGSNDGSQEIIKNYSKKDTRIRLIEQKNLGAGAARNNGLRLACGKYVHFLDSDDWLDSRAYETICDKLINSGVEACVFQKFLYDNVTGVSTPSVKAFDTDDYITNFDNNPSFFIHNVVVPWNKICRRDLIVDNGIWFDEIKCANDRSFYFKLILCARDIMVTKEILLYYRINNSKSLIGTTRSKYYDAHFYAFDSTFAAYKNKSNEIKRLVIDAALIDMFRFYDRAHPIYKFRIYLQLHAFFQTMDMSSFNGSTGGYSWSHRYEFIKNHKMGFLPLYLKNFKDRLMPHMNTVRWTGKHSETPVRKGLIVSLTSYPARIDTVHKAIISIFESTVLPERVILWLAEEQFPKRKADLPKCLLKLEKSGLDIRFCKDLKPHKKYFYTMLEYPDNIVITVDDDIIYDSDMIDTLLNSYERFPDAISGMRVHRMTFTDGKVDPYNSWIIMDKTLYRNPSMFAIATGAGGILYPPNIISKEAFDEQAIIKTCLFGDDLWLKMNEVLNEVPTVLAGTNRKLRYIDGTQESSLWLDNKIGGRNDRQLVDIDAEIREKRNVSPIGLLASYGLPGKTVSYLADCSCLKNIGELVDFRKTMGPDEELICYNIRNLKVLSELRGLFFYDLSVKMIPNNTSFDTPLFFLSKCAEGKYIQNLLLKTGTISDRSPYRLSRTFLKNSETYHLNDSFSMSILRGREEAIDGELSTSESISIDPELYNSRSVLMLRRTAKISGNLSRGINYYSKMVFDSVVNNKEYGEELAELNIHSVYDCNPSSINKNLCPLCGNPSIFKPYGKSLRDNAMCPECGSLERHRTAVLALSRLPLDHAPKVLFVNSPATMRPTLREFNIEMCGIDKLSELPGKYDVIIHCHTLKKDENPDKTIWDTISKLKKQGIVLITLPVKNTGKEMHYISELGTDLYNYMEMLELRGLDVDIRWNIDSYDPETLGLYGLRGDDLILVCTLKE